MDYVVIKNNNEQRYPLEKPAAVLGGSDGLVVESLESTRAEQALAVLFPSIRGTLLLANRHTTTVNGKPLDGGAAEISDGDRIRIADVGEFKLITCVEAQLTTWRGEELPARCPVCRAYFAPGDRVFRCGRCGTPHHEYCFEARNGRCGVFGCTAMSLIWQMEEMGNV